MLGECKGDGQLNPAITNFKGLTNFIGCRQIPIIAKIWEKNVWKLKKYQITLHHLRNISTFLWNVQQKVSVMKEPKFHICHRWISFFLGPVTAVCNCSNMALVFIEQSFSQNFNIFDVLHVSKFCGCQFRFPVQVSASLWAQVFSASARVLVSYFVCTHSQSPKDMRPDRYRVRCTHMRNQFLVAHT